MYFAEFSKIMLVSLLALCMLGLTSTGLRAEPLVDSVAGNWSVGGDVQIDGSGFGNLGPNVILYDNFSGGVPGETIRTGNATVGSWVGAGNASFSTLGAYVGSQSAYITPSIIGQAAVPGNGPWGYQTFQEFFTSVAIRDLSLIHI